jgi:hypothetical protein
MARRSLRPHLNQIRGWVRQGRTDAWIAHQLEATVQQIETFKRDNDLLPADTANGEAPGVDFDDEIDLRAEDDARVAAELEAAEARRLEEEAAETARQAEEDAAKAEEDARRAEAGEDGEDGETAEDEDEPAKPAPRRRGRRGGRGRARSATGVLEGTFDHGEEGYGLWLDPAVADNPVYAEHWAGHRPVEVTIEEDQIVIRRSGPDGDD